MSWRRAKTSGWAAFDPKKQQKEVIDHETHNHPYPLISSNISTWDHCQNRSRNGDLVGRSFSSVLAHSASVPNMMASENNHSPLYVANIQNVPSLVAVRDVPQVHAHTLLENSQSERMTAKYIENDVSQIYEKLKDLHPWANENLVEDIVTAVDNDIDKASDLLREMASPGRLLEKKETEFEDNMEDVYLDSSRLENTDVHIGETTNFPESAQVSQSSLAIKNDEPSDDHTSGKVFLHDNAPPGLIMDRLNMVPVEPEWEDDDMYLMHRKEAIRAMRLASRHSKAATEAYLRRDHAAVQEFSAKAREEWRTSEKLNAKAAKEILAIRNCKNDDWKLDLHGLHAAEAVQVLLEHLLKIESQVSGTRSKKPDKTNLNVFSTQAASLKSVNPKTEKLDAQQASRPRLLEVITGKGSHSRGEAALPVAIKNFLSEKGYYYYEARIGVITVQPKFRQLSTALSKR
ncbi:uncharacterized protein LOC112518998 [Cynara cardunculus var. scolymus]|uniref:Smr domain-containing protein n=1 Tax=Cynara cardunculus var. scolymus TaxID=59895 RepID=A0A103YFG5_CYNCS|nr:uncharacterized protein LOC112518998 [Cynara cardunculus var. scolymus]KVI08124.1 protein of unknown function DUF1771 [Cynara cardunculus var. scolymus]